MKYAGKLPVYSSKDIQRNIVSIGFECLDRDVFDPEKCYSALAETGIKYARCQTGWAKCEKEKGKYDFAWLDRVVDKLIESGITPWFNVGYGNPLYMNDLPNPTGVGCVPLYYGDETVSAWKNFLSALAVHFRGRVREYEIWNESNINHFWYPEEPNGKEYARLIALSGKVIRASDKNAKIGACTSGCSNYSYISDMLSALAPDELNFFCYHSYNASPEKDMSYVPELHHVFKSHGFGKTEIWDGEGGYPSWAYECHFSVPSGITGERAQAVWQLRHFFIDAYLGAKRISFFQAADMWEKPYAKAKEVLRKPAAHGILNGITYTKKKSFYTIQNIASMFADGIEKSDDFFAGDVQPEDTVLQNACIKMSFRKNGLPLLAFYLPTPVNAPAPQGKFFSATFDAELKEPVLVDTYKGEVYDVEVEHSDWNGYFTCRNIPLTDYPMIITEKELIFV